MMDLNFEVQRKATRVTLHVWWRVNLDCQREAFREALGMNGEMTRKTGKAQVPFSPGTFQSSLLRNRLHALRMGERLMMAEVSHHRS